MPKISTEDIRINNHLYRLEINYSSQISLFYSVVPSQFKAEFNLFDEATQQKMFSFRNQKFRGGITRDIVVGRSETELRENFQNLIRVLSTMATKTRPVIMVSFESDNDPIIGRKNGDERISFNKIGMSFGFWYAVEFTTGNEKPKYYQIRKYNAFGEEREDKEEIHTNFRRSYTIIDDTPENRVFLENMYGAFKTLIEKMKGFTKDESSLIELINSRQKLLL